MTRCARGTHTRVPARTGNTVHGLLVRRQPREEPASAVAGTAPEVATCLFTIIIVARGVVLLKDALEAARQRHFDVRVHVAGSGTPGSGKVARAAVPLPRLSLRRREQRFSVPGHVVALRRRCGGLDGRQRLQGGRRPPPFAGRPQEGFPAAPPRALALVLLGLGQGGRALVAAGRGLGQS